MSTLSIKQKIMFHLYRFRRVGEWETFNLPWEMTQDGVATSLMISRAHSCLELKNLEEKGFVTNRVAHVKGGKTKRKVYFLTDKGLKEYERIRPMAGENDILADLIGPGNTEEDEDLSKNRVTDALGCICVLRAPVPKDIFPVGSIPVVRVDDNKMAVIDSRSKTSIINMATEEQLKTWHSMAADVWLDHWEELDDNITSIHERIYHLVRAGRNIDACRLISANIFDLIFTCNEDLHDSLRQLDDIPDRFIIDVLRLRIEADRESDDLEDMRASIDRLSDHDPVLSRMYMSDLVYCNGDTQKAMEMLSELDGIPMVRLRMTKILIDSGDLKKAKEILSSIKVMGSVNGTEIGVERFILMARIEKMEGHDSDAYSLLMKAKASVTDRGKRRIGLILRSMDLRMLDSS